MQVAITFPSDPSVKQPLQFGNLLGQGKFKVYLVKSSTLNTQYALKVFSRDYAHRQHHSRETTAMSKIDHPHIIKHIPYLSHDFRIDILLTEYLPNGDLFDFVSKGCMREEKLMRTYFHQLIEGLEYLHNQGIAHLDLKLDNLLLDADFNLKIIDFDQAHHVSESKLCSFGTTGFRAPEVRYNICENFTAVDVYAAGVILYAFMTCEFPFMESDNRDEKEMPSYDEYILDNDRFWKEKADEKGDASFFSKEFQDLVNGMLRKDASERFTIREIKNSQWYKGSVYSKEELKGVVERALEDLASDSLESGQ